MGITTPIMGGTGDRLLLLIHGMGASGAVWHPLADLLPEVWDGRFIAVDLPGHGRSGVASSSTLVGMTAAVAQLLEGETDVTILGHSLGGAVALGLSSGPARGPVRRVIGVGIKCVWSPDDLAGVRAISLKPMRVFPTRQEAVARALLVAGLAGLADQDDRFANESVVEVEDGWRPRWEPRSLAVGAPPMRALLDGTDADVLLARGENDQMVSTADLAALVPDPVVLDNLGHNAHVEDPAAVAALLER